MHGAKIKRCSTEGCTANVVQKEGVRIRHGVKLRRCISVECTSQAKLVEECVEGTTAYRNTHDQSTSFESEY